MNFEEAFQLVQAELGVTWRPVSAVSRLVAGATEGAPTARRVSVRLEKNVDIEVLPTYFTPATFSVEADGASVEEAVRAAIGEAKGIGST